MNEHLQWFLEHFDEIWKNRHKFRPGTPYAPVIIEGFIITGFACPYYAYKVDTLLSMRKEDKATGIVRIPYIGEGKSTRYYVPLLQAYKDRNMTLVNQLAKEMEKKK